MMRELAADLPEASRMALSLASARREMWLAAFALDACAGRAVLGVREPIMAQLRLAWWRDQLRLPAAEREKAEDLLSLVGSAWRAEVEPLIGLVDGWESLLAEPPLGDDALASFVDARAGLAAALALRCRCPEDVDEARRAGRLWALADIAQRPEYRPIRSRAMTLAEGDRGPPLVLPRTLRPLALLGGLSRRALARGGSFLLGDRFSPIVAFRMGLLGR